MVKPRPVFSAIVGLLGISALLLLANFLTERFLDKPHWQWYIANGSLIAVMSSFVKLAWSGERDDLGLISPHPAYYVGSWSHVLGLILHSFGSTLKGPSKAAGGEVFPTAVLILALLPMFVAWLILVMPAQYLVYLICGAPARYFARTNRQSIYRYDGNHLEVKEIGVNEPVREGWTVATFRNHPLETTNAFAALAFFLGKEIPTWIG